MATKTTNKKAHKESLDERIKAHRDKLLHLNDEQLAKETESRLSRIGETIKKFLKR